MDPENKISFSITTEIMKITQGQSRSGHSVQGNHILVLSRISPNAETTKDEPQPVTPTERWWGLGGF